MKLNFKIFFLYGIKIKQKQLPSVARIMNGIVDVPLVTRISFEFFFIMRQK